MLKKLSYYIYKTLIAQNCMDLKYFMQLQTSTKKIVNQLVPYIIELPTMDMCKLQ